MTAGQGPYDPVTGEVPWLEVRLEMDLRQLLA
jgi:hypothetical protein